MANLIRIAMTVFIAYMAGPAHADAPPKPYFNGFEKNTDGWFDTTNGGSGKITRVPSGYTNGGGYAPGINSSSGKWHARLVGDPCYTPPNQDCTGPHTNWGGYSSTFPRGGYLTQVDIYLDVAWAASHYDYRFDWSSAINQAVVNAHRRDWVFNVGTQRPAEPSGFWVNASTNAFRSGAYPENPCPNPPDVISNPPAGCRMPIEITRSGWYTFRHTFRSGSFLGCPESECLIVDFDIFDRSGALVPGGHWRIHSSTDPMSMVGGNRYGWFANEEIPDLAIDNSLRTGLCQRGHGDGGAKDEGGHSGHHHFHKKSTCGDLADDENDNVRWDDDSGSHFQSTAVTTSTLNFDEDGQILTMIGSGVRNGLPVGFTMIAVSYGEVAPPLFQIVLTDGYTFIGRVESGIFDLQ